MKMNWYTETKILKTVLVMTKEMVGSETTGDESYNTLVT